MSIQAKRIARSAGAKPESLSEGPYDTTGHTPPSRISNSELSRFVEFVERLEDETEQALAMRSGYREVRMMVHLMRNHLAGRLTTPSSLAAASGLTYGTASRAVTSVIERGLVIKRPRTKAGKAYSLHPSTELIREWEEYARRIKTLLGSVFGMDTRPGHGNDYFFGASYMSARIIPPPAVLEKKLNLQGDLRILVHADPTFMAMNTLKKQFEMIFGVGIGSRALSIDRLREEIHRNAAAPNSRYDIIACDLPWFGELASQGMLLPLDDLLAQDRHDISDFHPEAVASTRYHGGQFGIPVQTTPELMCYREDLFEEAGIPAPLTAADTLEAARQLHAPGRNFSGIAWNAARGTPVGHSFIMIMAAFGQPIIDLRRAGDGFDGETVEGRNFKPMFLSDAARETAEYLRALLDCSPPNILNMSWYERAQCFAQGKVAMAYCYSLLAPLFELNPSSPAFGNTGYLPHPAGPAGHPVAPLGGYALAIPANLAPERIEPTWAALRTLTSPSATKLYLMNGSVVSPRFSVSSDPQVSAISPIIPAIDQMARTGLLQMWPRPPIAELPRIVSIVGEEIHDMLTGVKTIAAALESAQARVDAMMRANGRY